MTEQRVAWQDTYAIVSQTTSISTNPGFGSGQVGVEANKYVMLLNEHPDLFPGHSWGYRGAATNKSGIQDGKEFKNRLAPAFNLSFEVTMPMLGLFFWLLMQNGVSQGAGPGYIKTCEDYTSSACEVWASVLRRMSNSGSDSFIANGCICRSLTITGQEGGVLQGTAEMLARDVERDYDASGAYLDDSSVSPVRFDQMDLNVSPSDISVSSFTYTVTNNAVSKHAADGSRLVSEYRLGVLRHTLQVTVPWDAGYVDGGPTFQSLCLGGGTPPDSVNLDQSGQWGIYLRSPYVETSPIVSDMGVTSVGVTFIGQYVTSTQRNVVTIADSVDRGIP